MGIRAGQAKGAYTGDPGSGASSVTSVTATLPVVSSGGTTPDISLIGLTGLGTANQYLTVNGAGTALTWVTAGAGGVTNVTAVQPLVSSGGATPALSLNGLVALGTSLQVMAVNTGATALEWVSCTGTGTIVRSISPALTGTATAVNLGITGSVSIGNAVPSANVALGIPLTTTFLTGTNQIGINTALTFQSTATSSGTDIFSQVRTAAAAFTMTNGYGVRIAGAVLGAGSAITNLYGLKIEDQGATRWGIKTGTGKHEFGSATNSSLGYFGITAVGQQTVAAPPVAPVPNAISDNVNFQAFMASLLASYTASRTALQAYGLFA